MWRPRGRHVAVDIVAREALTRRCLLSGLPRKGELLRGGRHVAVMWRPRGRHVAAVMWRPRGRHVAVDIVAREALTRRCLLSGLPRKGELLRGGRHVAVMWRPRGRHVAAVMWRPRGRHVAVDIVAREALTRRCLLSGLPRKGELLRGGRHVAVMWRPRGRHVAAVMWRPRGRHVAVDIVAREALTRRCLLSGLPRKGELLRGGSPRGRGNCRSGSLDVDSFSFFSNEGERASPRAEESGKVAISRGVQPRVNPSACQRYQPM